MNNIYNKVHDQLPVFTIENGAESILYSPGYFLKINSLNQNQLQHALNYPQNIENKQVQKAILDLLEKARQAKDSWEKQNQVPFTPECLTIHVGSECNLNCIYCYSKVEATGNQKLKGFPTLEMIISTLKFIHKHRSGQQNPLTVVYHGSGEPTLHWQQLVDTHQVITEFANENGIKIFSYIATNACLSVNQIDWLAKNINLIGISCDGPRAIQKKQRIRNSKCSSIDTVCQRIKEKDGRFDIMVTVTPDTIGKLSEITNYLIEACHAQTIRIEPVYLAGENSFKENNADVFFKEYIKARNIANFHQVSFEYSGMRINEIHGTYCDVLRNTIRLTADGITRNCFCFMAEKPGFTTGGLDIETFEFSLDKNINDLKSKATTIPDECSQCINIYHCSRGCPEFCVFENGKLIPFRCRLNQLMAVSRIKELAGMND
jgi:radical SAM protein with 4Fe4S-binding SPASM domain